jgi:hypoxanthine phosphoribosyltransferase
VSVPTADPRLEGRTLRRVVYDAAQIAARVGELGAQITRTYPDGDLLVLGLLKGSFIFLSDLVREINRPLHVDFLVASSYGDATVSSGNVRNPQSLEICALLHKHIAEELKYETKFVGFDAPHEFLVGYGLDHAESFRHIPYIASLL